MEIPEELDTKEFREVWSDFLKHRAEKRSKMTETAIRRAFAKMTKWGHDRAVAALDHSISQGYTGIYESQESRQNKNRDSKSVPSHSDDEITRRLGL